ncbi:carboxyvinyl-carboxyphosphonate phosphorylmutase [Caballeronia temeraria]|uniref:Carboxyvinyl-carboxyphosphonate phosphorylmutase n=1 Tax=Caballeronia temeraria TaxID=1777137 RepID=A0A158DWV1_9BURK|nr:isocitrate lyase/PEP mutase family protein [Caballeronia temeraria]SAK99109.1 carboxyvinyl-carboxyphosphonate phosphorylmutase [Caballeronia temeraria]
MKDHMLTGAAKLREIVKRDRATIVPLALDPISARMAEAAGFETLYLGGGTLGYLKTGTEANISLSEMVQLGVEMRSATELPIILDGTCGWGDPMHMHHTIAMAEAAGFAAIELEDQLIPRRAHHHIDIEHVIPMEMMVEKIKEAVAARRNPDFMIIARTNALRSVSMSEGLRRAEAYKRAGADMLYVLQKRTDPSEIRTIGESLEGPLFFGMLAGLGSIGMPVEEMSALGYRLIGDGSTPFLARQRALRLAYEALAKGLPDPTIGDEYEIETRLVHQAIDLRKLLDIEIRTVEH